MKRQKMIAKVMRRVETVEAEFEKIRLTVAKELEAEGFSPEYASDLAFFASLDATTDAILACGNSDAQRQFLSDYIEEKWEYSHATHRFLTRIPYGCHNQEDVNNARVETEQKLCDVEGRFFPRAS